MSDAIQVAHQRRKEYAKSIATKENEIVELKELIADLDSFIEFGDALIGGEAEAAKKVSRPVVQNQEQPIDLDDEWGADDAEQGIARVLSKRTG